MPDVKSPLDESSKRSRRAKRGFRIWEKKRGSRQTGSTWWGGAGETVLYTGLFVIGIVVLTELISLRVIWKTENFLTSNWGLALSVLMLGSLIVTGAVGAIKSVLYTGTSAERRAAFAKNAIDSELLSEVRTPSNDYPAIPNDTNWRNSPGIRLKYRLPHATSPSWRLGVVASFCLAWNGAVGVLAVIALNQSEEAFSIYKVLSAEWWTIFRMVVLVYAVIGALAIKHLVDLLMTAAAIGPTNVEVSELPMLPGNEYRVFISQAGHLELEWLEMLLVCDEKVSFSDGTDTRTEVRRVIENSVFRHDDFEIVPSQPFQCDCPLDVPAEAMHSFVAANNAVIWQLIVRIQPKTTESRASTVLSRYLRQLSVRLRRLLRLKKKKWPTIERVYPLVLHPATS